MASSERGVNDPKSPASDRQVDALKKFGAHPPLGLQKGEASDWIDLLVHRLKSNEKITDEDLAEPPHQEGFVPASSLPPSVPTHVPVPAPNGPVEYLPPLESWATYEHEVLVQVGVGVTHRRYAKVSDHPAPGETFDRTFRRIKENVERALEEEKPETKDAE